MITWKVENPGRLLTEVKNRFSGRCSIKNLRWLIEHNRCYVNKQVERFGSTTLKKGDEISFLLEQVPHFTLEKERVLFEDEDLLVYDKPPFLTSEKFAQMANGYLVHRLDRDTSGVMLLAKTPKIQKALENQFRARTVHKEYLAIVEGRPSTNHGIVTGKMAPLQKREGAVLWGMSSHGLWSQTKWELRDTYKKHALLHCIPITGRTHQIRVHLKHIGHPILGDFTYGSRSQKESIFRPLLHAVSITFTHPTTQESLNLSAPVPIDFILD